MIANKSEEAIDRLLDGWTETVLGEVAEPISKTHEFMGKDEVVFINTGDILSGKFLHKKYSKIQTLPGQAKKTIARDNILFSEIRPINKRYAFVDFDDTDDYVVSTKLMVIKAKGNILPKYLYQVLISNDALVEFQHIAESRSGTFPQITFDSIKHYPVFLPPIPEQTVIAKILSDLDEKIELNNQMNKTLESIAQALFKQWFVDFEFPEHEKAKFIDDIPEGWQKGNYNDLVTNIKKSLLPGDHLNNRKYVPIECIPMKGIGMLDYRPHKDAQSSLIAFEKGDILFGAMRAYFHRVNFAPFKGITRTTTFVLRPKKPEYLPYSLLLLNMDESVKYADQHSKGTTMPYAIWENGLAEMPVVIPNNSLIALFSQIVNPILEKMACLSEENSKLHQIRNSLLPRLMSGKIRVQK
jgi:type I restriction enzyme S subunit